MRAGQSAWQLANFEGLLSRWDQLEQPHDDLRLVVTAWIFSRYDDPYVGMPRETGFANLWAGAIPGTGSEGRVVVWSYFVYDRPRVVVCSGLASLSLPL